MFRARKKSMPPNSCGLSCSAELSFKMLQDHDVHASIQVIRASKSTQAISATDIHPYFRPAASFNASVSFKIFLWVSFLVVLNKQYMTAKYSFLVVLFGVAEGSNCNCLFVCLFCAR